MKAIILLCSIFAVVPLPVGAQTVSPLKSFAYMTPHVSCAGNGTNSDLMPLDGKGRTFTPPAEAGSGAMPTGSFTIRRVAITHSIDGNKADAYAVVGHSGPNGDWISPMVVGEGGAQMAYDADAPVVFTAGEYLDIHASCAKGTHWATMAIWYTVP